MHLTKQRLEIKIMPTAVLNPAATVAQADKLDTAIPTVIETVTEDGTEWGVSFAGSNPHIEKYVGTKTKDDAFRLRHLVERSREMTMSRSDKLIGVITSPLAFFSLVFLVGLESHIKTEWMYYSVIVLPIFCVAVFSWFRPQNLTYSAIAHLIHAGKAGLVPVVIETTAAEGPEWGLSFDGYNPRPDKYVAMKDKDSAFRAARLLSCTAPSPA
jgi:hypothetical protein